MRLFNPLFFLLLATTESFATALPPILDTYPRCDYKILQQISSVSRAGSTESDADHKHNDVLITALSELRAKASGKGDALILRKVTGELSRDRTTFIRSRLETEIIYRLEADVIMLCNEDSAKPIKATIYNSQGKRQIAPSDDINDNATVVSMVINTTIPSGERRSDSIDNANISLTSGFHGATIGSSRQQLETLFGPADNFFPYNDNIFTLSYGNQLWLTFADNKLIQARHSSDVFSYSLTNQLPADRHPKLTDWLLDNHFSKRSLLEDIEAYYTKKLHRLSPTEFTLQQKEAVMRLSFNHYFDIKSSKQQTKLTDVSFAIAALPPLPPLQIPTVKQIKTLATQPATAPLLKAGWVDMFSQLPVTNYSTTHQQKQLKLYRPELAAVFSDNGLNEVQFSLLTQNASLAELQQLLNLFSLPMTRQQFIEEHQDAFETAGKLVVYHDTMEINATFTDDDVIDSLILKWF